MLEKALKAFDQSPEATIKDFNVEFYEPFSAYYNGFKEGAILSDRDSGRHYALHRDKNTNVYFAVSCVHSESKPQIQQTILPKETCSRRNSKLFIASYEHEGEVRIAYKLVKNASENEHVIFLAGDDVHE